MQMIFNKLSASYYPTLPFNLYPLNFTKTILWY